MPILVRRNSGYRHGPCRASWLALFSGGRRASDVHLEDPHDPAAITIDVRNDGFLRAVVAASREDAAEAIVLLCPGPLGKQPTIEGETVIPGRAARPERRS